MTEEIVCAYCKRMLHAGYLRVTRIGPDGAATASTNVCSLTCLINWAYVYSAQRFKQGMVMGKHVIDRILAAIRGG